MVVMTAKVSKVKLIVAVALVLAVIIFAVIYLSGSTTAEPDTEANAVNTNEDRIAFLESYGWRVSSQPVETEAIIIPEEMDDVLAQYNELQKSQGLDLTDYAGKQAKRYVYEVTNYENASAPVYATLLVYQGTVIGGDLTLTDGNGTIHGFAKPTYAESTAVPTPEESVESLEEESDNSTTEESKEQPIDESAVPQNPAA